MQKINIVLSVMIGIIILIYSCNKENEQIDKMRKSLTEMNEKDQNTLSEIFEFRDKIYELQKNPTKSSESTTIDSAVWYLDATMNLSHAFISWEPMKGFSYDSIFISLLKTNGEIGYNELATAYAEFKQKTKDVCIRAEGENKELYIASMSRKEETTDSLIVKFDITIGKKGIQPGTENPFSIGWKFGDFQGDCNVPPGNLGKDACTELTYWTNVYKSLYLGQAVYVYDPFADPYEMIHSENPLFLNPNDPNPEDNEYEHLLIYQKQIWGYQWCIDVDAMNWYYHRLHDVIYDMVPSMPQEWPNAGAKDFVQILPFDPEEEDPTKGILNNTSHEILHQYKVEYRHMIAIEGVSEPISIMED